MTSAEIPMDELPWYLESAVRMLGVTMVGSLVTAAVAVAWLMLQ